MLFGPKKETSQDMAPAEPKPKVEPYEIRVMPPKFHKYLAVKNRGLGRFILILLIVLIVLGGVAFGAFYFMNNLSQPVVKPPVSNKNENLNIANENNNANINILNENANENLNANFNLNENANTNVNENVNLNVNANENVNLNNNVNAVVPPAPTILNYSSSQDSDNDGLTDPEEDLYGTEKRKPDTDGDGYLDGEEVLNLFNPKAGGGALLENSGLVNIYKNPALNYEIFYPSSWLAKPTDQSLQEVIFQSATSEYIQVLVQDNPDKLDLVKWYNQQSPQSDLNLLEKKTAKRGGYQVLVSPDKLTNYIQAPETPDKVYVITYNIDGLTQINFLTTFGMMVNSFKVTAAAPSQPGGGINSNVNAVK